MSLGGGYRFVINILNIIVIYNFLWCCFSPDVANGTLIVLKF